MSGRELTREQVSKWRENWSWDDRRVIVEHMDRLEARTFSVTPSGDYVRCYNRTGSQVMRIGPGYIEFTRGNEPANTPPDSWLGLVLSTNRPRLGGQPGAELDETFCKVHGMPVRASGLCDTCEEESS